MDMLPHPSLPPHTPCPLRKCKRNDKTAGCFPVSGRGGISLQPTAQPPSSPLPEVPAIGLAACTELRKGPWHPARLGLWGSLPGSQVARVALSGDDPSGAGRRGAWPGPLPANQTEDRVGPSLGVHREKLAEILLCLVFVF